MARSLLDFAKSMERRATRISVVGNEATKRKVMAAVRYLAYNTPVDTSELLSNWQVVLDRPAASKRGPFFPGLGGSTQDASAQATINFAAAILAEKKPGQRVYISNVAPYVRRLNDGGGKFMPGGFVEAARLIIRNTQ